MHKPSTFAERLKNALDYKQMTKAELSRLAGISKSSLTRYAKGDWEGKQDAVYAIAQALNVNEAWLMGYDAPMEKVDYSSLLTEIAEENKSGRPAAVDEMRHRFGTEHSTLSAYVCEDKKKLSVIYYHALERGAALALKELIQDVEQLETKQVENIMYLVKAYLKAEQPIRDIVDTALRPYTEEESALYEDQIG